MNVKLLASGLTLIVLVVACAEQPASMIAVSQGTAEMVTVRRGEFTEILYLSGDIESVGGEIIVVPRIPNWQTSIKTLVQDGSRVEAGDVISELDSTQFSTGLEERKQGVADAVQSIAQQAARNEADLTQLIFDVEKKQVEFEKATADARIPKEIISLRDWEENQLALRRAEIEYEKVVTDLESKTKAGDAELANLRLDQAKAQREIEISEAAIEALILNAGSAGVVVIGENGRTGRKFQVGDTVWVGMKLASIPDLSSLRVSARLIDVDDGRVAEGMRVSLVVDAFPERTFKGTVAMIGTVAEALTVDSPRRGFTLLVDLDDANKEQLRPGYSVRAAVERSAVPDALLVPRVAVDFSEETPVVRNRRGAILEDVRLGACNAQECVVISGLEEGDRVAPAGANVS